jgi:uncharacterized damage-inducible protein DinB
MGMNSAFIGELKREAAATRKMLERVPLDKGDWKPHEKSMSLKRLALHVAEIIGWITVTIEQPELDFTKSDYKVEYPATTGELLTRYDQTVTKALDALAAVSDETLMEAWTLRNGEHLIFTMPRVAVLRSFALSHMIHHRGQLSVYLRLLDVPLPSMYGPTADEQ